MISLGIEQDESENAVVADILTTAGREHPERNFTMAIVHSPSSVNESAALAVVLAAVVLLAFVTLYLVGFDQGALSRSGMLMHEVMHDGRHLLGLPCH